MLTPEQYQALNNAVDRFDKFIREHPEVMDKKQALEAMERIFNYCEEIDLHIPEDERTGYNMLPDVQLVEQYILSKG